MSKNNINLPSVILTIMGDYWVEQNYPNITIKKYDGLTEPQAFNKTIKDCPSGKIYGFLSRDDQFAQNDVIQLMLNIWDKHGEYGFMYTDRYLTNNDDFDLGQLGVERQYFPSSSLLTTNSIIINTPFFCTKAMLPTFNEQLEFLYFHDAIKQLHNKTISCHIPTLLITTLNKTNDYSKDLQRLNYVKT